MNDDIMNASHPRHPVSPPRRPMNGSSGSSSRRVHAAHGMVSVHHLFCSQPFPDAAIRRPHLPSFNHFHPSINPSQTESPNVYSPPPPPPKGSKITDYGHVPVRVSKERYLSICPETPSAGTVDPPSSNPTQPPDPTRSNASRRTHRTEQDRRYSCTYGTSVHTCCPVPKTHGTQCNIHPAFPRLSVPGHTSGAIGTRLINIISERRSPDKIRPDPPPGTRAPFFAPPGSASRGPAFSLDFSQFERRDGSRFTSPA
jgi:hypothetical protein